MDQINMLLSSQLTEREVMTYLLVENSGLSNRKLAEALGISHTNIALTHKKAKSKMEKLAKAGFFQTPVDNSTKKH